MTERIDEARAADYGRVDELMRAAIVSLVDRPPEGGAAVLCAAALRAAGLHGDEAMVTLAALASAQAGGLPACLQVGRPGETEGDRVIRSFHANGTITDQEAKLRGRVHAPPPGSH